MAKILYFGRLTDITGTSAETLALPANIRTSEDIRNWADARHNAGGALLEKSVRIAINNEMVTDIAFISDTDEVAFMPPVGGG